MNRLLKLLAWANTIVMYIVLQMGALVTNSGSADGCGASWPLCHGTFMPEWDYHAIIEFSHRGVSAMAGMFSVMVAIWVWYAFPQRKLLRWLSLSGVFFVCLQGGLGAAAVIWPQPKAVLALHFGISLICFSMALLTTTLLMQQGPEELPEAPRENAFRRLTWFTIVYVYAVTYLGAFVRHLRASQACIGWPLCNGQVIPDLQGMVGINFAHRVAAGLAGLLIFYLAISARNLDTPRRDLARMATIACVLVVLQILSGAILGIGQINVLTQMIHTAILTLLWGSLTLLSLRVSRNSAKA